MMSYKVASVGILTGRSQKLPVTEDIDVNLITVNVSGAMVMARFVRAFPHQLYSSASAYWLQNARVPSMAFVRAASSGYKFSSHSQQCPGLTQQRRSMSKENIRWLWPAQENIYFYDAGDRHGTRKWGMGSTLNTAKPLQPQHFKQALIHLQRRLPNLRACIRPRGETLWYCEPSSEPKVNFKMIEDEADRPEINNKLCEKPFSYTDPVQWRAVLVPRGSQYSCSGPEVKNSFPYQYDYIFHLHHGLGDGMDAMLIMSCTVDILNNILAGRPVDENQWGHFTDKEDLRILKDNVRKTLMENPKRIDEVKNTMPPAGSTPLLLETFPKPSVTKASTGQVERIIEPDVVKQLKQRAREAGVSFNSSMVAAINTAIVELAKEAGNVRDSYTVKAYHSVTLRHYLKHNSKHVIGPYAAFLSHSSNVDHDVRNCFWEYSKKFHQELRPSLKSGLALEQDAVTKMTHPEMSPDDYYTGQHPVLHDYEVTNMGDISKIMSRGHEHIQLTKIFTYISTHSFIFSNFHQFFIIDDRCFYTISYSTNYHSHETVNLLADKVLAVISDVGKS